MAVRPLDESSVEKKLRSLTNTQDSIQGLSLWIIHHKAHHEKIVELWFKAMKKGLFDIVVTEEQGQNPIYLGLGDQDHDVVLNGNASFEV